MLVMHVSEGIVSVHANIKVCVGHSASGLLMRSLDGARNRAVSASMFRLSTRSTSFLYSPHGISSSKVTSTLTYLLHRPPFDPHQ